MQRRVQHWKELNGQAPELMFSLAYLQVKLASMELPRFGGQ
jgi:hypothetical protein